MATAKISRLRCLMPTPTVLTEESGLLNYEEIEKIAQEVKPLILLAGYSAYPRLIDFKRMSEIAHSVGAVFMVDMVNLPALWPER